MDTVASVLYQKYLNFADNLKKRLVATYGHDKANRLFQTMDQSHFEAVLKAASGDALKRQWLSRLEEYSVSVLHGGKAEEAA